MKTFELTQEQIDRLAEKKHAKKLLQEFVPEAFKTELEVGRWYRLKGNPEILALYDCFKHHRPYAYIFNENGNYEYRVEFSLFELPTYWELATEEEVREALINEAKKRGFNNIGNLKIKNTFGGISNGFVTLTNNFYYDYKGNTLRLDGALIFNNGVWAEIIEEPKETEPTEEEIKRVLNYLLKNGEKLHNEI